MEYCLPSPRKVSAQKNDMSKYKTSLCQSNIQPQKNQTILLKLCKDLFHLLKKELRSDFTSHYTENNNGSLQRTPSAPSQELPCICIHPHLFPYHIKKQDISPKSKVCVHKRSILCLQRPCTINYPPCLISFNILLFQNFHICTKMKWIKDLNIRLHTLKFL